MNKHGLRWGLLVGGALILIKLLLFMTSKSTMNSNFLSCTAFIPYLFGMYMAAKDQREVQGGRIRFWQAAKIAWLVVIVGTALVLLFNYLMYFVISPDLLDAMKQQKLVQFESMDMEFPDGTIEMMEDMMENNFGMIFKYSLFFSFIFLGVIVGFIGSMIVASAVERRGEGEADDLSTL